MTTRAARRACAREDAGAQRRLLAGRSAGGLRLTPGARARISARGRSIVAPPGSDRQRAEAIATARASSLPFDVLLSLAALERLADEGNRIAAALFEHEARRLGVWVDRRLWWPGRA